MPDLMFSRCSGENACGVIRESAEPISCKIESGDLVNHTSASIYVTRCTSGARSKTKSTLKGVSVQQYSAIDREFLTASNLNPSISEIATPPSSDYLLNKNVKLINFHYEKDFKVPALNSSVARFGAIIAIGNTLKEALMSTEEAFNSIRINELPLTEYPNYNPNNKDFKN